MGCRVEYKTFRPIEMNTTLESMCETMKKNMAEMEYVYTLTAGESMGEAEEMWKILWNLYSGLQSAGCPNLWN